MNRAQFLGAILSPVLLLFNKKQHTVFVEASEGTRTITLTPKLNHFEGTHVACPDCGRMVERGLMSWTRHNEEYHITRLQWDGNEITAPEHLNIHMSASKLKELQATLKKPWWEQL